MSGILNQKINMVLKNDFFSWVNQLSDLMNTLLTEWYFISCHRTTDHRITERNVSRYIGFNTRASKHLCDHKRMEKLEFQTRAQMISYYCCLNKAGDSYLNSKR